MSISYIGKYTYGVQNINLHFGKVSTVTIGSFCSFSANINIFLDANHWMDEYISTWPFGILNTDVLNNMSNVVVPENKRQGVIIGNDVWVGTNATIMNGVYIGDGSIIAANSHVVKDVEPYSMVGGNPAKLIKYRHSKEIIEKLIEIQWWHWNDERINQNMPLICQSDVKKFIEEHI